MYNLYNKNLSIYGFVVIKNFLKRFRNWKNEKPCLMLN